jgi:hypothetical protein
VQTASYQPAKYDPPCQSLRSADRAAFFLLDSIALNNIGKQPSLKDADAVEILPGLMPKIIRKLVENIGKTNYSRRTDQ